MLEVGPVDVAAQIAIEARENRVVHRTASVGIDVTEAPGQAPAIAAVGKRVGHERPRRDGRHLDARRDAEVYAVGGVLDGVLLGSIQGDQRGHAFLPGPHARLMTGIDHRIQRRFLERTKRMIGHRHTLHTEDVFVAALYRGTFVIDQNPAVVNDRAWVIDLDIVP